MPTKFSRWPGLTNRNTRSSRIRICTGTSPPGPPLTYRSVGRAALPGITVAILAAITLSAILIPVLHLSAVRWLQLLGVTLLTALTFIALNQPATAIFKRPGRFASITVLVLAVVTSLTSAIPRTLYAIGNYLPTHPAILALRGVIIGSSITTGGITHLVAWLIAAALATLLVTEHRRSLGSKQLRLGSSITHDT